MVRVFLFYKSKAQIAQGLFVQFANAHFVLFHARERHGIAPLELHGSRKMCRQNNGK